MDLQILSPFAFVLMPFSAEFDEVYRLGIKRACDEAGVECQRVDEQHFMNSIVEHLYKQIERADIVIADMTGHNPNVYYEAGYAMALRKPIIFVSQESDIPFDLKHYPHILYSGDIKLLRAKLREKILASLERAATAAIPSSTLKFHILNKQSSLALDVVRLPGRHPYGVHEAPFRGLETQMWRLYSVGNNYYRVQSIATGKCLSVDSNSLENGARVIQWDYFASASQHWSIRPGREGSHQLVNEHSGKCLEVCDELRDSSVDVAQWTWHGADRQRWWLLIPAGIEPQP